MEKGIEIILGYTEGRYYSKDKKNIYGRTTYIQCEKHGKTQNFINRYKLD